jgi:hypothetical protein
MSRGVNVSPAVAAAAAGRDEADHDGAPGSPPRPCLGDAAVAVSPRVVDSPVGQSASEVTTTPRNRSINLRSELRHLIHPDLILESRAHAVRRALIE